MERTSPTLDSLKLSDGLDVVELLDDVEQMFAVRFGSATESWDTVGDLETALLQRFPAQEGRGACPSSMAFYRLRRAASKLITREERLKPETPLRSLGRSSPKRLYAELSRISGLAMPDRTLGVLGWAGVLLILCGLPGFFAAFAYHAWWLFGLLPTGVVLARIDPGSFGGTTLGELAQQVSFRNYGVLTEQGADRRPITIWRMLRGAVSEAAGVEPERIGRQTAFF